MADEDDQNEEPINENEDADGEKGAEGEDGEGEEEGGGKKKIIIIVAAVVVLVLVGAGAGLFFSGALSPKEEMAEGEHSDGEEHADDDAEKDDHGKDNKKKDKSAKKDKKGKDDHGEDGYGEGGDSNFVAIPTMIVNLSTDDGAPRYLRLSVQLELEDASEAGDVEAVMPRVIDQFQTYLRELRVRDLRGSAGIYRLQTELLWRVNQAAAPVKIKDVLFQEILIQ